MQSNEKLYKSPNRSKSKNHLGITAVNSATPDTEVLKELDFRRRMYSLKEVSSNILNTSKEYTTKIDRETGEIYRGKPRTWHCCKTPVSKTNVSYARGKKGGEFFTNLQHCASYWVCPVCAKKIESQRTLEIAEQLEIYEGQGYEVKFITLTLPHYKNESLKENLDVLIKGFNYVRTHRHLREYGKVKYLRSLEVTYGQNGFHPHLHCVFLIDKSLESYPKAFKSLWLKHLAKNDKKVVADIACRIDSWNSKADGIKKLADYLTKCGELEKAESLNRHFESDESRKKWAISDELVRGQSKKAKQGYTPFQILGDLVDGVLWEFKRTQRSVYKEFADTIKRKRMIQTSRGFFNDVRVKSDEEITQDDEIDLIIYTMTHEVFYFVRLENRVMDVLLAYRESGILGVQSLIREIVPNVIYDSRVFKLPQISELAQEGFDYDKHIIDTQRELKIKESKKLQESIKKSLLLIK